ncbi:MAG: hypothetical protein QG670_41 [Thermoproteota archaeon]|nr:hypothetical protein [Thermoproteota archaeon]
MSDKSLGLLIFAAGLVGAILYLYWLFAPVIDTNNLLFYAPIGAGIRWAIVIPIVIIVLAVLIIGMWIGWTMAATPSPTMLEEKPEETIREPAEEK